jgi:carboxyl-terminal processing protease
VQSILPLGSAGGIKLTTARYFTPSGRSIQAKGIVPDVVVEDATVTAADQALRVREADLENHLANPNGEETPSKSAKPAKPATPPVIKQEAPKPQDDKNASPENPREPNPQKDYQLSQA